MYLAKTAIDITIDTLITDKLETTNQTLTKQNTFC